MFSNSSYCLFLLLVFIVPISSDILFEPIPSSIPIDKTIFWSSSVEHNGNDDDNASFFDDFASYGFDGQANEGDILLDHYIYTSGKKLCFDGLQKLEEYAKKNTDTCMFTSEKWQKWKEEVMMMKPLSGTKFRLKLNGFPRKCMAEDANVNEPFNVKTFFSFDANKFLFNNCPKNVNNLVKSAKGMQKVMGELFWTEIEQDFHGVRIRLDKEAATKELLNEYIWKFLIIWMFTNLRQGLTHQRLPQEAGIFQGYNRDYENELKWLNERIKIMVEVWFVDKFNGKKLKYRYKKGDIETAQNGIIDKYMKIYSAFFDEKIAKEMLGKEGWRMLMENGRGKIPPVPAGNHDHDRHDDDNLQHHNPVNDNDKHQQNREYQEDQQQQHYHLHLPPQQQKPQLASPHSSNQKTGGKGGFMPNIGRHLRNVSKILTQLLL